MIRLFVADDEDEIRERICRNIRWQDYDIEICGEAGNGLAALEQMLELQPDVAIMDIRMPVINGLDLIEAIHDSIPNTRIIILSGYDDFEYAQRALRAGAVDYLLKPCRSADILKAVQKSLRNHVRPGRLSASELFEQSSENTELSPLLKAVSDGSKEKVKSLLQSKFRANEDLHSIKIFAYRLITHLSFLCAKQNITPYEEPSWCRRQMADIIACTDTAEILAILIEKTEQVYDVIHPGSTDNMIVRMAVSYIRSHYNSHLSLELVAEDLKVTPKYLSSLFKQTVGINFTDYVQKVRIDEACRLLRDKNYKIYEVAWQVGYSDVKYFFSIFKKTIGITPTKYRNNTTA